MDLLFRRHRDFVYRVLWSHTGNRASAEDLTQEVFLRVATRRKPFFRAARFTTFLFRVAANLARDHQRKLRRETPLLEGMAETSEADLSSQNEPVNDPGLGKILAAALARLPRRQREVIILRELEELSTLETAQQLGISQGSVKTHRSRALKQLKNYFDLTTEEEKPL